QQIARELELQRCRQLPAVDPALQDRVEDPGARLDHPPAIHAAERGAGRELLGDAGKDPAGARVAHGPLQLDQELDEVEPHRSRVRVRHPSDQLGDRVGDELLLRIPSSIDRRLAHPCARGHALDAHRLQTQLAVQREGGVEDRSASQGAARATQSGTGRGGDPDGGAHRSDRTASVAAHSPPGRSVSTWMKSTARDGRKSTATTAPTTATMAATSAPEPMPWVNAALAASKMGAPAGPACVET